MRYLLLILTFICSLSCLADDRDRAVKSVQKVILSYPVVKRYKKNLEKKALKYIPMDKKTVGVVGGVALSASQGYLDTRVIKKMNFKVVGADARPNIRYNFRNGDAVGTLDLRWGF